MALRIREDLNTFIEQIGSNNKRSIEISFPLSIDEDLLGGRYITDNLKRKHVFESIWAHIYKNEVQAIPNRGISENILPEEYKFNGWDWIQQLEKQISDVYTKIVLRNPEEYGDGEFIFFEDIPGKEMDSKGTPVSFNNEFGHYIG